MSHVIEASKKKSQLSFSGKTQQQHFKRITFHCSHEEDRGLSFLSILLSTTRLSAFSNHHISENTLLEQQQPTDF